MKLKRIPIEISQSFQVIKNYIGSKSNLAGFIYCVGITSQHVHDKIVEEAQAKQKEEEVNVEEK